MIAILVSDRYPDPHPRNVAPCGCDGHGQVHHGTGALSYVVLCKDRDCCERRDAAWMGVSAEDIAAYFTPSGAHDRATGRTAAPDVGDDPRVPQRAGVQPSPLCPAPGADAVRDLSAAASQGMSDEQGGRPFVAELPPTLAGEGIGTRGGHGPSPVEHRHGGRAA